MEPNESNTTAAAGRQEQIAAWVQFPRRVALLIIAFAAAFLLINLLRGLAPLLPDLAGRPVDWSVSQMTGRPVREMIGDGLVYTLALLIVALVVAFLLAVAPVAVALLAHRFKERGNPAGAIVIGFGRLVSFSVASVPVAAVSLLLILIFVIRWRMLPLSADPATAGPGAIILPAVALALLPALLSAQAVARELARPVQLTAGRRWSAALFRALATLSGQTGGLLSAIVVVEVVFNWPGFARLTVQAAQARDYPVLFGTFNAYIMLVLIGQLAAEFFRWLERLARRPQVAAEVESVSRTRRAGRLWVGLALLLLLLLAGLMVAGLATDADAALQTDLANRLSEPSPTYPWGTDELGRDVRARALGGVPATAIPALVVAIALLLPSTLIGGLAGYLAMRRTWAAESAADLVRLPVDVLLFFPLIPGAILVVSLLGPGTGVAILAIALLLLARAARAFQTTWRARPVARTTLRHSLLSLAALFFGTSYVAFALVFALDFLGLGTPPPTPTLGSLFQNASRNLVTAPWTVTMPLLILWAFAFGLYTAADAVIDFSHTKRTMARLNE